MNFDFVITRADCIFIDILGHLEINRIYGGLRPRQGNLRLVFRLFSLMRGLPSIRLQ